MGVTLNIYIASIATLDGHAVEWNTILLDLYTMDKKLNAARGHYHLYLQSSGIVHSVVFSGVRLVGLDWHSSIQNRLIRGKRMKARF